jgi:hypothetical protein
MRNSTTRGSTPTMTPRVAPAKLAAFLMLSLLMPGMARAHFLWLEADRGGKDAVVVRAFLSETPTPDLPEFLKTIAKARITAEGRTLSWTKGEDTYLVTLPVPTPAVVDGVCDLGVMKRNNASFRLLYTARVQFGPSRPEDAELADLLRLRLTSRPNGPPIVQVRFRGRPAPGAVVKAFPESGEPVELKADAEGRLEYAGIAEGRVGLLAKWVEKAPGQEEGKTFDEVRYYATLTVAPGSPSASDPSKVDARATTKTPFAMLPEAVNSFGGAVSGDWLYVYSGHLGVTHKYHEGTTSKHFRRLNLKERTTWEELPPGPPLQGVTLMAHKGMLYRIGGMSARNRPDEPDNLVSVADFARFDPRSKTWTDLPKLPAPRSTHDAVVVGDKIYVVGGWSMNGGDSSNSEFCEDTLVFDLGRADGRWESLPSPPVRRRALAVGEVGGKIFALGGLTEEGKVVKSVDVYDPEGRNWSRGPELPGGKGQGFAPSAFGVRGRLYLTGSDGIVYRLNTSSDGWDVIGKLAVPRIVHRLLPGIANDLLAVGGTVAKAPTPVIESIPCE